MSTVFPILLRSDHKILGSEYCSAYADVFGQWNVGFYCPQTESKAAVTCCGTPTYKYCCTTREEGRNGTAEDLLPLPPYLIRAPVLLGILAGTLLVLILIIITSCYFCSCCFFYRKRRARIPPGLYRLPLASASTNSGLLSVYSPSSTFSTPLDLEWSQVSQAFTPAPPGPPNNLVVHNNQLNNSRPAPSNRNGGIFTTQPNGWLANSYNGAGCREAYNGYALPPPAPVVPNNNATATLPRYFHYHQGNNRRHSGPAVRPALRRPPRPEPYVTYESRPYLISDGQDPARPQSFISFRNNVAYITSTLPLSNSFTGGARRGVRFGGTTTLSPGNGACSRGGSNGLGPQNTSQVKSCNLGNGAVPRPGAGTAGGPGSSSVASMDPPLPEPVKGPGCLTTRSVSDTESATSFGAPVTATEPVANDSPPIPQNNNSRLPGSQDQVEGKSGPEDLDLTVGSVPVNENPQILL